VGDPEMLALVEISGWFKAAMRALAILARGYGVGGSSVRHAFLWMNTFRTSRLGSLPQLVDLPLNLRGPRGVADRCVEVA
jgi:hypothetical protein